jgi:trypsin-like peptidase
MMKTLIKAIGLLIVLWSYAIILAGCTQKPLAARILPTAVHIMMDLGECSGTIIRSSHGNVTILTARHCVDGQELSYVQVGGLPKQYPHIKRVVKSKHLDLAIVELTGMGKQTSAIIADSPIPWGEPFELVGLSYEVPWAISRGYVMGGLVTLEYAGYSGRDVPLACTGCDEGDSGSGVFNSQGMLTGVLAAMSKNNIRTYAVPLADIRVFLKKALD